MFISLVLVFLCCECVFSQILGKYEGANCTWQERSGKCALIYKCRTALDDIKKRNPPPICSFNGLEPVVCCTTCSLEEDIRKIIYDNDVGTLLLTGPKAEERCYDYLRRLKYPGKHTFKHQYHFEMDEVKKCINYREEYSNFNSSLSETLEKHLPHLAYLGYGEKETTDWLCQGTVISNRFILTAAECVRFDLSSVRFVALNIHNRWSASGWEMYNVKRSIPHPDYKPPSKYHDIALLELDSEITFGPNVLPACIYSGNNDNLEKKVKTIIWSKGENSTLETTALEELDEFSCSIFYPQQETLASGYNHTTQMCFGNLNKATDSCEGEMGSPLQTLFKSSIQMVLGVNSFKRQCGEAASTGLFTRVSYYVPWIESIVWS